MFDEPEDPLAHLESRLAAGGAEALLEELAGRLRGERKYHELFDALLLAARWRLGLDLAATPAIDELPEPKRTALEDAYLAACREVGQLLLADRRLREAWMYLRPAGQTEPVAAALARIDPTDENLQELVEIALHEGVAPELGYRLVLERYGTCNAITAFEGLIAGRSRADQQMAAGLLVRQVHREVLANVRSDIERRTNEAPRETTLPELIGAREWLFGEFSYHVDTTHLNATVRFARVVEDRAVLALAWELTDYGRRLSSQFQFAGEEPFAETYLSHGLFFAAQLGRQVDEALQFFRQRAESLSVEEHGPLPAETYVALLARVGRLQDAIDSSIKLLPPGTRTTGLAPSLLELSRRARTFERWMDTCRSTGDLVGYATGLLAKK